MSESRLSTEMGHVLFMDIVGFARASMEEQTRLIEQMQAAIQISKEFATATARDELVCCDTGDGVALIFLRDPLSPVESAIQIAEAARKSGPPLRMGIHSGPISRMTDVRGQEKLAGGGLNKAQRVMDCGDAGHILLSASSAEVVTQYAAWSHYVYDLGEAEVKHGERIRIYNFHNGRVGNPELPDRIQRAARKPATVAESREDLKAYGSRLAPGSQELPCKIALLYKRNVQPDDHVLELLERRLAVEGFEVFVDRHLSIGVEWAREIERQVCSSDAVIPLISAASVRSEMLEYEIKTAHEAAQVQRTKPRILPVRVRFTDLLPQTLAVHLDKLNYAVWSGPEDDERLVAELLVSIRSPNPPKQVMDRVALEPVGGAVPLDSEFYVVRPVDREFIDALARRDSVVLVKGARQMGKTSLLARGLNDARHAGARVVLTDFQTFNEKHLRSADTLLLAMANMIAARLGLAVSPRDIWDEDLGANMNMDWFLEAHVLGAFPEPLVWGLDEVDRLFACEFGGEVFGLFRSWHNRRALEPSGPWSRLTLAIAYATEAHLFITDLNQSPFNVGTRLAVEDFTLEQVADLNQRYGAPLHSMGELERFYALVGGHPYLVRRGLDDLVNRHLNIETLECQADRDEGLFGDHLRRLLVSLSRDAELTDVVRSVLRGGPCPTPESFYRLRSAGVLTGESAVQCRPRCKLYSNYLSRHLL